MRGLRRYFGLVSGKMDSVLADALIGQLQATEEGGRLAAAMTRGEVSRADARERMREIEHRGDTERGRFVEQLSGALVTPIDREDLFRLSRSIDDVLDTLRDFVRESHLFRIPRQDRFVPFFDQVLAGIEALERAAVDLVEHPTRATRSALEARKAGGAIRRMYQYETARIFGGAMKAEAMKERELVRRLEMAGIQIGEAADAIADGAIKRWH